MVAGDPENCKEYLWGGSIDGLMEEVMVDN